jgi:uncharacterized protein
VFAVPDRDDKTDVHLSAPWTPRLALALAAWLVALEIPALTAFPRPDGYVNDYAAVLAEADEAYLEDFLRMLERDTSAEVAVATVTSLDGMAVEEYAHRLFAEWGIGKARRDNGVLLLVAPHERAVRIEVGYGLESILPDGMAGEIIRTEILSEFRAGNMPRGIGRGLNRIAQIVRRDAAADRVEVSDPGDDRPLAIAVVLFFGIFVGLAAFVTGLGIRTRTFGPLLWSGLFGGIPLVIATAFVSPGWIAGLVSFGLLMVPAGYRSGRSGYWRGVLRNGTPGSVHEDDQLPWVMGGTSGSSSSDSSSDSGGSSSSSDFGGGSSGGGGASGRW